MSIQEFNVKEQWIGTGLLTDYTFDFTIHDPSHILIILQDGFGNQVAKFRGDDTDYLADLTFDSKNGGGTISLSAVLTDQYVLTALLAPDEPTQTSEFRGKFSFTFGLLEMAFDVIVCQVQRLAYLAARSLKLHDLDDIDDFDMTMPKGAPLNPGATLVIKDDGSGFAYGATLGQISGAEGFAAEAEAARDIAIQKAAEAVVSAAAAAASAAAAACSVLVGGTVAAPLGITAAGGITSNTAQQEAQFINGSPGAVVITANPQISPGAVVGKILTLIGVDDGSTVTLTNGNGLIMNGDCVIGNGDAITFFFDGTNWRETGRVR